MVGFTLRGPRGSKFVVNGCAAPVQRRSRSQNRFFFPTLFCRLPLLRSFQTQQQATALDASIAAALHHKNDKPEVRRRVWGAVFYRVRCSHTHTRPLMHTLP